MFSNNMFERFSIPKLIEIIGESKLEQISGALELLNLEHHSGGEVYTKGFLSNFATKAIGYEYINSVIGFNAIFDTLNLDEAKQLLGSSWHGVTKQECLANALVLFKAKSKRKELFESMGIHFEDAAYSVTSMDMPAFVSLGKTSSPYKPLKDYQFEVYFQALDCLKIDYSRFILQMPTGSGKTRTAMEIITSYINTYPDASVVWLAHSTELCDQAAECFLEVWPHVATKELNFQRYYSLYNFSSGGDAKVNFLCTSFQSAYALISKDGSFFNSKLHNKRLIVVDEAHKVIAPTYKAVTQALQCEGTQIMGLTATPGRKYTEFNTDDDLFKPMRPQQATIQVLASAGGVSIEDFLPENDEDVTVRFDFGDLSCLLQELVDNMLIPPIVQLESLTCLLQSQYSAKMIVRSIKIRQKL